MLEVDKNSEFTLHEKPKIIEWMKAHYTDVHIEMLTGTVEDELFKHLIEKKDLIVVMGAFGRNAVSAFFKESRATLIMRTTNLPIFIAHY
ncbi:MAG: hypothetical protein JST13_15170 [Bacteroidetes bacterium]|nr:hypothetical protein [Bacteroidota bacterium]